MQAVHREMVHTIQEIGLCTNSLILDECNESTCCVADVIEVGTNKYELLASTERVEVKIGYNQVTLATTEGCFSCASHNLTVAHGFMDGRVVISTLQE